MPMASIASLIAGLPLKSYFINSLLLARERKSLRLSKNLKKAACIICAIDYKIEFLTSILYPSPFYTVFFLFVYSIQNLLRGHMAGKLIYFRIVSFINIKF